jgi:chromosome segregation ATPase
MAARKKKPSQPPRHRFTVVLQEIRDGQRALGGQVESLREQMHAGFDQVDRRFEQVDQDFEQIHERMGGIDLDIGRLKDAVLENRREIKAMRAEGQERAQDIREIRAALDKKVDRDEVETIVEGVIARGGAR